MPSFLIEEFEFSKDGDKTYFHLIDTKIVNSKSKKEDTIWENKTKFTNITKISDDEIQDSTKSRKRTKSGTKSRTKSRTTDRTNS